MNTAAHTLIEIERGSHPFPVAACTRCGLRVRRARRAVAGRTTMGNEISVNGGRTWKAWDGAKLKKCAP